MPMGETKVDYINDPSIYPIVLRQLASTFDGSNGYAHGSNSANGERPNGNTQGDTGSSGNGGKLRN